MKINGEIVPNKRYTTEEMCLILERNGFVCVSQNGSHKKYVRNGLHLIIKKGLINEIFWRLARENNIDVNVLDKKYWKKIKSMK